MEDVYFDGCSFITDANDAASGYSYRISLTDQPLVSTNDINGLNITYECHILRDDRVCMTYDLQISGVIAEHRREFIRRKLKDEVGVPSSALNDTLALIYELYCCRTQSAVTKIEAHVRIETYHTIGYEDGTDWVLAEEDSLRPTPASREAVEALEKVVVDIRERSCVVCLEELSFGYEATKMPCSHVFHGECIVKWLENQFVCPLCRFELPPAAA